MIEINKLIAEAMKSREKERLETLKLIKAQFLIAEKSGEPFDEAKELKILLKMIDQRNESIEQYKKANREDLVKQEESEIKVIKEFIPEQPTEGDIAQETERVIDELQSINDADWRVSMRDMKTILTKVQEKYPTANGKIVSNVLKSKIQ